MRIEGTGNKLEKYAVTETEIGEGGKVMNEERNVEVRVKLEKGNPQVNRPKKKNSLEEKTIQNTDKRIGRDKK